MNHQKGVRTVKLQGKYLESNKYLNYREPKMEVPWLSISGKWMAEAGFKPYEQIDIIVGENELIIRRKNTGAQVVNLSNREAIPARIVG